jgi:muramidase (phage lysozyme)
MAFTVGNEQQSIFSRLRKMTPANRLAEFNRYQSRESPTPFTFLTPTQFAELFPKYYMEKLPDVGGFFKALNSRKELGGEGKTYGPHGNTEGTASASSSERVTNTVRAKEIYDYIRSKGVDHNHAVGIINNMKYESRFDSGAIGDGGTSGGLFQHHAERFAAMKSYVGEGWQTNWKKQVDFAMTEGDMKKYLSKDYANPSDASMGFTREFERPANTESTAAYRAGTAAGYATAMSQSGPSTTTGGNFETTSSGYVVPKDKTIYSPGNEQQCATLAKGFNPEIGRSSSWTVVPGEIKPGVTVATMRYNLPGGDRTGSGYHSGVAMSSPDKDGNFLLLEQFNGQPPRVRQVNVKYGGGAMGGSTEFGLISSNGKLHTEQSMEALNYGARISGQETQKIIQNNAAAVSNGDSSGSIQGTGSVSVNDTSTPAGAPGPQTNLQQQETVKNIQTATIGDMFKMVGDLAGFFMRGEGVGGGGHRKGHRGHAKAGNSKLPSEHETHIAPVEGLLSYISQGEGGYNAMNQGTRGKKIVGSSNESSKIIGKNLSDMSVGEVMDMQKGSLRSGRKIFAAGRYQMIPSTLRNAAAMAGIGRDAPFNKETQDKLGMALIQGRPKLNAYLTGKSNDARGAMIDAAKEWRSIPHPDTGRAIGAGPNAAHHKVESVRQALASARTEIASRPVDTKVANAPVGKDMGSPVPQQQTASITPAQVGTGYLDQIKAKMSGYYEGFANKMAGLRSSITGQETSLAGQQPEFPAVGVKQNEVPLPPHRPTSFDNAAPAAAPDKHTFNVEKPTDAPAPKPVVADTFLSRDNPQFASPSMERQIKNTMNPVASNEGHSFLPSIG